MKPHTVYWSSLPLGTHKNNMASAALLKALRDNDASLTEVSLQGCGLKAAALKPIAAAMATNNRVTQLNLQGNAIGDEGAEYLADMLLANTSIEMLR
jgi:hypothetical protein